jgi:hypothetical protein
MIQARTNPTAMTANSTSQGRIGAAYRPLRIPPELQSVRYGYVIVPENQQWLVYVPSYRILNLPYSL